MTVPQLLPCTMSTCRSNVGSHARSVLKCFCDKPATRSTPPKSSSINKTTKTRTSNRHLAGTPTTGPTTGPTRGPTRGPTPGPPTTGTYTSTYTGQLQRAGPNATSNRNENGQLSSSLMDGIMWGSCDKLLELRVIWKGSHN